MSEEVQREEIPSSLMVMSGRQLMQTGILGVVVGLLVWGLATFLGMYVFKAVLCQGAMSAKCGGALQYGEIAGTIIGAGVGLFGLIKLRVFRPLLVVLAAMLSLWGLVGLLTVLFPWDGVGLACVMLYGLSYLAFAWIARIRTFWVAALLVLILVVVVRLLLVH